MNEKNTQNQPIPVPNDVFNHAMSIDEAAARFEKADQLEAEEAPNGFNQQQADEQPAAEAPQPEPSEATEAKETDEAEEEAASEEQQQESQETGELPSSIDDLARELGTDVDTLMNLNVSANGKTIPLRELANNYSEHAQLSDQSSQLTQEREALQQLQNQTKQYEQQLANYVQDVTNTSQALEQEVLREFNNVDWQSLQSEDPADYAAKRLAFQDRWQAIQNAKQKVQYDIQQMQQQQQQQQQQQYQALVKEQRDLLLKQLPEWRDDQKRGEDVKSLTSYLKNKGFQDYELGDLSQPLDHRYIALAKKAMLYDELQQKKPKEKQIKTVSPYLKSKAKQSAADIKAEQYKARRQKLKKSGKIEDAVALLSL